MSLESKKLYQVWQMMQQRCDNPKNKGYHRYGGRGISIDPRWRVFANFISDMGARPAGHTLDRRDNDGNYCKSNCRWATPKQQSRNMVSNRLLTYQGQTLCIAEWAERTGLSRPTIEGRLLNGWSVEDTLSFPPITRRTSVTFEGYTTTVCQWEVRLGTFKGALRKRLLKGLTMAAAVHDIRENSYQLNSLIEYKGESRTLTQWAEIAGISYDGLRQRISKGWPLAKALTVPVTTPKLLEFAGQSLTLSQWAEKLGWERDTIKRRLLKGWSTEKTLTTPMRTWATKKSKSKLEGLQI